jgi:SAM-dependent methyltransferase
MSVSPLSNRREQTVSFLSLRGRPTIPSSYAGVPEFAVPGLHERLFDRLQNLAPSGSAVVDLASGAGAWAKRLLDQGYEVTACDIHPEVCAVHCLGVDLNEPFSELLPSGVDVVTCIEMLEHVENPRHVLREAFKLLRPGGVLLLSTPNASGLHSRVKFLMTGKFAQFDEEQYDLIGHIRPITHWELDKMLIEVGFNPSRPQFFNHYTIIPHTLGEVVKMVSSVILTPFVRGPAGGQILIMTATKP